MRCRSRSLLFPVLTPIRRRRPAHPTYDGRQIVVSMCVKALDADANDRSRPVTETVRI